MKAPVIKEATKFNIKEAAKMTGLNIHTIRHYVRKGGIEPEYGHRRGRRRPYSFSFRNLQETLLLKLLIKRYGLTVELGGSILRGLKVDWLEDFFDNPAWGSKREILCYLTLDRKRPFGPVGLTEIKRDEKGLFQFPTFDAYAGLVEIGKTILLIPVGRAKVEALISLTNL